MAQRIVDRRNDLVEIDGFFQVVDGAQLYGRHGVAHVDERREQDDGQFGVALLDLFEYFDAGHPRHAHVEQHRAAFWGGLERGLAILAEHRVVAGRAHGAVHELALCAFVVHDGHPHPFSHPPLPGCAILASDTHVPCPGVELTVNVQPCARAT